MIGKYFKTDETKFFVDLGFGNKINKANRPEYLDRKIYIVQKSTIQKYE